MSNTTASITQRRIGLRFRFEAGEDVLKYFARDYSGERTIEIPYEAINLKQPAYVTLTATPLFRRLFGLVVLLFLMAAAFSAFDPVIAIVCALGTLPLSVAAIAGKLTGWSNIRLKLFQLQPYPPGALGPMRIIDDEKGVQIVAAIGEARKAKLRRLYGEADLTTDPSREIARLTWLKDHEVLSEDEWTTEVDKVKSAAAESESVGSDAHDEKRDSIH